MTTIKFTGTRAFRFDMQCLRWMPIAAAKAQILIATGQGEDVTGTEAAEL